MIEHTELSEIRIIRNREVAPRETRAANTLNMSVGSRLGIVRSYEYGGSRPELRPLTFD